MSKSATIPVRRGGPELNKEAKSIFEKIGLALSSAVSYFYPKSHTRLDSPVEGNIPNRQTRRAMKDIKLGRNLKEYNDADEMFRDLGLK
jgi:antitoxin component of RelBE/YafQ-DinJ toxin-antitoxin module